MIYTVTLNPALDKTFTVDQLAFNQVSRIKEGYWQSGGKGFNVSRALTIAGIPNCAIGLIGGTTGEQLLEGLKQDGLDVFPLIINGETRVNQVFMESPDLSIKINSAGPSITVEEYQKLINTVESLVEKDDIWAFCGSLPQSVPVAAYQELTMIVHKAGGKVFLDTSGAAFQAGLDAKPDWIKPNLEEARLVFSEALREQELLAEFLALGISGVILTAGSKGLVFADGNQTIRVNVPKNENENVVGAGDATVAGFVYGVIHHLSLEECVKWAAAFGCAAAHASDNCFQQFSDVERLYQAVEAEQIHG